MFIKIINVLALIAGILGSLAYFTQAYKIMRNKSSRNVSVITYYFFLVSVFIWLVYGIVYESMPIIVSNTIAFIGCLLVVISYYIYRHSKRLCDNCGKLIGSQEEYHRLKLKHPHYQK